MVYGVQLSQLTTFIVANVSRRRTDQTRNGMFLLVFTHVDTRHQRFIIEQVLGKSLCQLGFTYTRIPKKMNEPIGYGVAVPHGYGVQRRLLLQLLHPDR